MMSVYKRNIIKKFFHAENYIDGILVGHWLVTTFWKNIIFATVTVT